MPEDLVAALTGVVRAATHDAEAVAMPPTRLSGGASRETWAFDVKRGDGAIDALILRRDPPGSSRVGSGSMGMEASLLAAAARTGVPVPSIVAASDDPAGLGAPFIIMERIEGETIPRRILRDEAYAGARPRLAGQCGEILARLHRIDPDEVGPLEDVDQVARYRDVLDSLGHAHPAFELGLRWLEANRPSSELRTVVHGDFRNGNLIVGPEGVRAVLDWELAHLGDPLEDLGWLCVKAWRFGVDRPVGGFGDYGDLVAAYEAAGGAPVDRGALRWWEAVGTLKWGIMCILQANAHTSGLVRSVELAAIGRRVCENEWDLLELLPSPWSGAGGPPHGASGGPLPEREDENSAPAGAPHDAPDSASLVEAVREFLERDVLPATSGRVQFHGRVAMNVLAMVEREIAAGPAQARQHAAGLRRLGFASDAELAAAIRAGTLDDRIEDVASFVRDTVRAKLAVANPRYVG